MSSWSNDLQIARVTHWGGMISTPDVVLQERIRNALIECACPTESIDLLMKNTHEKHWPQGLSTLETRQQNRQYYESFICRQIPNEQAVVVLSCDNPHMNELMSIKNTKLKSLIDDFGFFLFSFSTGSCDHIFTWCQIRKRKNINTTNRSFL